MAATAVPTCLVSGPISWPGRATIQSRTRTRSSSKRHRDRRPEEEPAHGRSAAADAHHARDLERGLADEFGDDPSPDRQFVSAHVASSASASAMSAGTRVRAVVAATSQAYPIMRRLARPWVMMTVPFTPSSGEPPTRS